MQVSRRRAPDRKAPGVYDGLTERLRINGSKSESDHRAVAIDDGRSAMWSHSPRTTLVAALCMVALVAATDLPIAAAAAQVELVPAQNAASLIGGERAQGAVIWSHGRSLRTE